MKTIAVLAIISMLGGCATVQPAQNAALENALLLAISAATGVYINPSGSCQPPTIDPVLLNPCAPVPSTATPDQMQQALTQCAVDSAVLVALVKYGQRICTPSAIVPTAR